METQLVTCKLIFKFQSMTEEDLKVLLGKYTDCFNIAHFNPESQVGSNKCTYAVVDVPKKVLPHLIGIAQDIDLMNSSGSTVHYKEKCNSGSCCTPK